MTIFAARASRLTLVVHAVDDTGALCGARPRDGKWRPAKDLPVNVPINCPRCLERMAKPRYVFCESPAAVTFHRLHIRRVGEEGISYGGSVGGARTYCGQPVGWDVEGDVPTVLAKDTGFVCGRCLTPYELEQRMKLDRVMKR